MKSKKEFYYPSEQEDLKKGIALIRGERGRRNLIYFKSIIDNGKIKKKYHKLINKLENHSIIYSSYYCIADIDGEIIKYEREGTKEFELLEEIFIEIEYETNAYSIEKEEKLLYSMEMDYIPEKEWKKNKCAIIINLNKVQEEKLNILKAIINNKK